MKLTGHPAEPLRLAGSNIAANYSHVPGLNGLRAASIMLVLVGHMVLPKSMAGVAAMGVFLFFAISGFLITRLLFAEMKRDNAIDIPGFFFRRYLRLYPVLLVFLAIFIPVTVMRGGEIKAVDVGAVALYYVNYLHNYYEWHGGDFSFPMGALWSLAVEEHFYLIMPFAFVLMKASPRRVFMFSIIFTIVPLLIRCLYVTIWPEIIGTEFVYRPSETRFDSIAVGVMVAALCEMPKGREWIRRFATPLAFVAGLALLLAAFALKGGIFGDTLRYTMRNFGCILLLVPVVFGSSMSLAQRVANWPIVDWTGRISYSLYIWHNGAKLTLLLTGAVVPALHGLDIIALTFLMAAVSYYFVEKPALRLKSLRGAKKATFGGGTSVGLSPAA